jgi:hypothetical protein
VPGPGQSAAARSSESGESRWCSCGSCLAAGRPPVAASGRVAAAAAAIPADSDGRRGLPVAGRRAGFPSDLSAAQVRDPLQWAVPTAHADQQYADK